MRTVDIFAAPPFHYHTIKSPATTLHAFHGVTVCAGHTRDGFDGVRQDSSMLETTRISTFSTILLVAIFRHTDQPPPQDGLLVGPHDGPIIRKLLHAGV